MKFSIETFHCERVCQLWITFSYKFGPSRGRSPSVGGPADVFSGVAREGPVNVKHDKAKIVDHADARSGTERASIMEPFDAHRSVADWFDSAVEMSCLALDQVQVFDFADETRRIRFLLLQRCWLFTLPQVLLQLLDALCS